MQNEETINNIEKELMEGLLTTNPSLCGQYVGILSGELSFYLSLMGEIERKRSKNWLEIRKGYKSDTQATRGWEITQDGIDYSWYETRIKRTKALITGLKTLIKMAEAEQYNLQ